LRGMVSAAGKERLASLIGTHSDLICIIPLIATIVAIRGEIQARSMQRLLIC
jgi:hypothetical protein